MDYYERALDLLTDMKESRQYFHPEFADKVIEGLIAAKGDDFVPDELCDWATRMWSR